MGKMRFTHAESVAVANTLLQVCEILGCQASAHEPVERAKQMLADISAYASQNTNLRNDLVQCGMARDAAISDGNIMKAGLEKISKDAFDSDARNYAADVLRRVERFQSSSSMPRPD